MYEEIEYIDVNIIIRILLQAVRTKIEVHISSAGSDRVATIGAEDSAKKNDLITNIGGCDAYGCASRVIHLPVQLMLQPSVEMVLCKDFFDKHS